MVERAQGLAISDVHPLSPFAQAGLARGDVLLSVDGRPVGAEAELAFRLSALGLGRSAEVAWLSDGDRRAIMVVAGADPYGWKGIAKHHRTPYLRRCAANSAALPAQAGIDESMRRGGTGMPGQKP